MGPDFGRKNHQYHPPPWAAFWASVAFFGIENAPLATAPVPASHPTGIRAGIISRQLAFGPAYSGHKQRILDQRRNGHTGHIK